MNTQNKGLSESMATNGSCTVALDVMGADGGPREIIEGGLEAARALGDKVHIQFVGRKDQIERVLSHLKDVPANHSVHHAEAEVPMNMAATDGVKIRENSIAVAMRDVKHGIADAFVSPGNTGA